MRTIIEGKQQREILNSRMFSLQTEVITLKIRHKSRMGSILTDLLNTESETICCIDSQTISFGKPHSSPLPVPVTSSPSDISVAWL